MRSGMLMLSTAVGLGLATVAVAFGSTGPTRRGAGGGRPAPRATTAMRQQEAARATRTSPSRSPRTAARPTRAPGTTHRVIGSGFFPDAEPDRHVVRSAAGPRCPPQPQAPEGARARAAVPGRAPAGRAAGRGARGRRRQRPARHRPEPVAHGYPAVPRGRLPRPLVRDRPAAARAVRRPEVRVPRAPRRPPADIRLAYGGADGLARRRRRRAPDRDPDSAPLRTRRRSPTRTSPASACR